MDTVTWDEQRQEFVDPNKAVFLSRPTWVPDAEVTHCKGCLSEFGWTNRKHHCRCCGCIFCANCSRYRMELPPDFGYKGPERVCLDCYAIRNQVAPATQSVQIKQKQEEDNLLIRYFVRDQNEYQFDKMDCDMIRRTTHKSICFMGHTKPDGNFLLICSICDSSNPPIELLTELGSKFFRFILEKIDHPYISKPDVTAFMTDAHKAIVMRLYSKTGSIRDLIYKISNPRTHFEKKYVLGKGKPLDIKSIAKYGRMVLEALMYLKKVGFPYPHLHAGNVLVSPDKSKCWISDQENCLLGYSPYYQLEYPHVEAEVECFGHLLYEMALGSLRPSKKTSATPIAVPSTCPKAISEILDAIFLGESSPMTVERLLEDPFFVNVEGLPTIQTTLPKMKPAAKQMLETIKNRTNEMVSCIRSGTPVPQYQSSDLEAAGLTSPKQRSTRKSVAPVSSSSSSSSSSAQPISSVGSPPPVARAASVASISSASPPAASRPTPAPTPVLTTSSSSSSISRPAVSSSPSSSGAISSSPSSAPPSAPTPPPAPAPPPAPSPPPPPPPSLAAALPPPQGGRSALLDAIKNPANAKKLKKVDKSKVEKKPSLAAGGGAGDAPKSSGNSMQDALMARFAAMNKNKN